VRVSDVLLRRGQSMWVPASDPDLVLTPACPDRVRVFAATVGADAV
jgi:mannose-6-phosphate isomerase